MKTMICATLVALAATASIGLPAAADEATASNTGTPFAVLNGIATLRMSEQELAATRGAAVAVRPREDEGRSVPGAAPHQARQKAGGRVLAQDQITGRVLTESTRHDEGNRRQFIVPEI